MVPKHLLATVAGDQGTPQFLQLLREWRRATRAEPGATLGRKSPPALGEDPGRSSPLVAGGGLAAPVAVFPHRYGECRAGTDGDCSFAGCPQLRDGEPEKTGRSCPLWTEHRGGDDDE